MELINNMAASVKDLAKSFRDDSEHYKVIMVQTSEDSMKSVVKFTVINRFIFLIVQSFMSCFRPLRQHLIPLKIRLSL